jgi:Asp-tRNA(Asn)/Glu-tRNA(Gln) amidotransferase C subunit
MEEEQEMIKTLESQLHFVQAIQSVDTTGVEPLRSIRDETKEAEKENAVTLESMKEELSKEEVVGHSGRIRRKKSAAAETDEASNWDPLALASKKIGRYIVVETGKNQMSKP